MIQILLIAAAAAIPQDTSSTTLPTVEVTVSRERGRSALELPFALTRVTPDSTRPGMRNASLDERLFLLPGVLVSNRNNPSQDPRISIRGFGSRSAFGVRGVRVQMDGIPLTLPDGQTALDYLDLESIGSLELIRGSASSLYGNAAGGVLNLRSRSAPPDPINPMLSFWSATANQRKASLSLDGTIGSTGYAFSASRLESDGYRDHSAQEVTNGSFRFTTDVGAFRIGGTLLAHDMPMALNPGALTLAELQENRRGAEQLAVRRNARKEVSQVQGGLTLAVGDAADAGELEIVLYGGTRDLNNPLPFAIVNVDRVSHGATLRAARSLPLAGLPSRITAGVDYQGQNDERTEYANCNEIPPLAAPTATCPVIGEERGTLRRDQNEIVTSIGPYLRLESEVATGLLLSAGVRSDRIKFEVEDSFINDTNADDSGERTLTAVSPMFGVVWRSAPLNSFYANYSTAFETPTATELGNQPDGSAGFNSELDPQRSATVEVGSRGWLGGLLPSGLSYDIAVFRTTVEDELIPFEIPGGAGRRYFRNAGSTLRTGVEAALATEVGPALLSVSYSYSHFLFDEYEVGGVVLDENRIPGVPLQQLQGAATLRHSNWYLTVEGDFRGSVQMDDANSARAAGYETMNVRLGSSGIAGLSWLAPRVGVQNVFDRTYAASISVNATNGRFFEPAPGRTVFAGLTIGGIR